MSITRITVFPPTTSIYSVSTALDSKAERVLYEAHLQ